MLASGDSIRLTPKERKRHEILSGKSINPNSIDELNRHIDQTLDQHDDSTPEGKLLKHILESQKITD